jgi:hypothetical protein
MCQIGLTFEYSRMKVPSLSRGCEIAQFFVRYMGWLIVCREKKVAFKPRVKTRVSITSKAMLWQCNQKSITSERMRCQIIASH